MARVNVGDPAPDLDLPASDGRRYRLSDLRGTPVVLAFYPNDMGPVCTKQLCQYTERWDDLTVDGAVVLGVSTQDLESHGKFIERNALKMPLLADTDATVARAYGVALPLGRIQRATFLIDREGVVAFVHRSLTGARFLSADDIAGRVRAL